ncbi:hypothetical protein BASA81_006863 [Batrachochytrium salamandrivorans]|nr:hypothetical protein BASA81_006863 [Batrachochytrium salamandrivorans]
MSSRTRQGDNQLLIEKIVRLRVRESQYWKERCFGLTADLLVDRAVELNCLGGVSSETNKPTPFLCLLLKMLSISPDYDIVLELIRNEEYKYVRCLGAMYLRMVGRAEDVYLELEPLLQDSRKLSVQQRQGWESTTVDQFTEALLFGGGGAGSVESATCFEIALPHLTKREHVVALRGTVRESSLRDEYLALYGRQQEDQEAKKPRIE